MLRLEVNAGILCRAAQVMWMLSREYRASEALTHIPAGGVIVEGRLTNGTFLLTEVLKCERTIKYSI